MLRLDWNLLFNIINLIVLYLLMKKFLIRPVTSIMEQRKALIQQQLANAGEAERAAGDLKRRYEEQLQSSRDESAKIVDQAKLDAKREYNRIVEDADSRAARILEDARKTALVESERTRKDAQSQIAGLAMAAAARVIGEQSSQSSDGMLFDQFLAKAGDGDDTDRN